MKQFLILLILMGLVLTACAGRPTPNIEATVQAALAATQTARPTNTPLPPANTSITPAATPTDTPTLTPTPIPPTATSPPVSGQVKGKLSPKAAGVKVTLCGDVSQSPVEATKCEGFEQSVTIDSTGHFLFSAIPPGAYYIIFDTPVTQEVVKYIPCRPGEFAFCDKVAAEGVRKCGCFDFGSEPLGPTVVVEAGKTIDINEPEIVPPKSVPQPELTGPVNAGGKAEVIIVNDSPFTLTVRLKGPSSKSLEVPACSFQEQVGCKVKIKGKEPKTCQTDGRPQVTVQISPGTYEVEERGGDFSVTGQWILQKDTRYQNCYFIVAR